MPDTPKSSETGPAPLLGTIELAAFGSDAAEQIADELRAALAPGIQVLRPLGAGAMGLVFLGRDPLLKRLVAIKVLSPDLAGDEIARGRFVRECEASAAVTHPSVAGIYLVGELPTSGTPYYVMQFIDGWSLAEDVGRGVATSELRARRLIGEIASALEAAHARGLVHRDVKPANIMIEKGSDRPIVLDFGISAVLQRDDVSGDPRLTRAGTYLGTPTYMSPEQATGEPVTGKSDVYALGLIAFELLSGQPPFNGPPVVVMAAHVEKQPPSLHSVRSGIDEHLAELVDRCLRKTPTERPNAGDVAQALLPGMRTLLEWPPPGLEMIRGLGARLVWRWAAVCVVALMFFLLLHVRPTLGSPGWTEGEQSMFWSGVMTPTDAVLNEFSDRRGDVADKSSLEATWVWMFLVSASVALLALTTLLVVWHTARFARVAWRATRGGYPWPVVFDVSWDRYEDTAALLNNSGVFALWSFDQRSTLLRARRRYAISGVFMVVLGVIAPLLWLGGLLRVRGNPSLEIVTPPELALMALPLFVGFIALVLIDRRARFSTGTRRRSRTDGNSMQAELASAWLHAAGRSARALAPAGQSPLTALAAAVATSALLVLAYVIVVVFLVVFVSTTRLVADRAKAEEWRASFRTDSTRPMRFTELDVLAKRSAILARGIQPDLDAARVLMARAYVRADAKAPPPALEMDLAGGRAISGTTAPDRDTPGDVIKILGDSTMPSAARLRAAAPYGESPWLDVWRRFAESPEYPVMWQLKQNLPGTTYVWDIPIMRYGATKDLAYRNSIAGLVALARGDVASATLRGRENIAAGRHIMKGVSIYDNLIGLVVIGIGRGELDIVARTTGDQALRDEMVQLRATSVRWRGQLTRSQVLLAMVADPESRDAIRYVKQFESPAYMGELLFTASAGFCVNARELLFGSDAARSAMLHDVTTASGNPRAPELEVLGQRWLEHLQAGTLMLSGNTPMPHLLMPLGWIGMGGFRDRARVCFLGPV